MKITGSLQDLKNAVDDVTVVMRSKSILANESWLYIDAEEGTRIVSLTCSGFTATLKVTAVMDVYEGGHAVISGSKLKDYLSKFGKEDRTITLTMKDGENSRVVVQCGTSRAQLPTVGGGKETPKMPELGEDVTETNGDRLSKLLGDVKFAAAVDDTRPILKGVHFEASGDTLTATALDGYRMVQKNAGVTECDGLNDVTVPIESVNVLQKMLNGEGITRLSVVDGRLVVYCVGKFASVLLMAGAYPDTKKLFNNIETTVTLDMDAGELMAAVERAVLFDGGTNLVKIALREDGATIDSMGAEGEGTEELNAQVRGKALNIGVNYRYLLDAVKPFVGGTVRVEFSSEVSPMFLTRQEDMDMKCIVLPVRVKE